MTLISAITRLLAEERKNAIALEPITLVGCSLDDRDAVTFDLGDIDIESFYMMRQELFYRKSFRFEIQRKFVILVQIQIKSSFIIHELSYFRVFRDSRKR